jgi:peptidoglycan/xylan/chitin deacetylase (PgdA/CDA1 family)
MMVCRAIGLFALARRLTAANPKILCYHGFELRDEASFRPKLFISPALFQRRLDTLKRLGYRVVSLSEAVDALAAGRVRPDSVVITVDDGFASFHSHALPALKRHGFPATVYVTSYYVDKRAPVFRLLLQYMFWKAEPRLIETSSLQDVGNGPVNLADAAQAERFMWACIDHGEQHCDEAGRQAMCQQLGGLLGLDMAAIGAAQLMMLMTPQQLRDARQSGVEIELHTHRHRFPIERRLEAQAELDNNRAVLAAWLGPDWRPRHFCYPSGEWDRCQWAWLDAMGLASSTTCEPGLNSSGTPHHALHRFLDGEDVHEVEFEAALCGFADLIRLGIGRQPKVSAYE